MSSVKRRKVDGDVPSGLLDKKKKHAIKKAYPVSASTSSEPDAPGEPEKEIEEEGTKTFKDLVRVSSRQILVSRSLRCLGYH
jgi:ATP-dependent RNA helicase DDX47/RRP3